jgi:4-hydroxy-tetrahydrodipicolinate reductase
MGRLVRSRAELEGHEIAVTVTAKDAERSVGEVAALLRGVDAAIDFSVGAAVVKSAAACALAAVPLVEGTTGWGEQKDEVMRIITEHDGAMVMAQLFRWRERLYRIVAQKCGAVSIGLRVFAFIEEAHHIRKRDAPSGTALRLQEIMKQESLDDVPISSTRAGFIPGTHRVGFDSAADQILLTHSARSRDGFAAGALLVANWIVGKKGVFEFTEVIDEIVGRHA